MEKTPNCCLESGTGGAVGWNQEMMGDDPVCSEGVATLYMDVLVADWESPYVLVIAARVPRNHEKGTQPERIHSMWYLYTR